MTDHVSNRPALPRRDFLHFGLAVLGGVLGVGTVGTGVPALVFPLFHPVTTGTGEFLVVGELKRFAGEVPKRLELRTNRRDAWNRQDNVLIGSVWVVRHGEEVIAFTAACPHLGCGIDYDESRQNFVCHCHKSYFDRNGAVLDGPSPRGLDRLQVRTQEGLLQVRFERFKYGKAQAEPVG